MSTDQEFSVSLTSEQVDAMRTAVNNGEYSTTDEIVSEAIRDWQQKRELGVEDIERLRQLWDEGKASGPPRLFDLDRTLASAKARRLDDA